MRFGAFEVDVEAGELCKHGLKIGLQDQPFQVLALLLERPGQVVTREEVRKRLWASDTFVDSERGLNRAISRLREALGDSAENPRFIQTLPKRGYRFLAPVTRTGPGGSVIPDLKAETKLEPSLRVPQPKDTRPRAKLWLLVFTSILVVAGAAAFFFVRQPHVLTERDTVVLADFDNRTGDPAFDYTLRQALAFDLEQSPFLKIVSDQEMADTLRLMGHSRDERLTPSIARDLCQRTGGKAVLGGSIANLGSEYVITLNAVNCQTGEALAQKPVRANRRDEVLRGLDRAVPGLRAKLGESLSSIQKFDKPLAVSTPSLEALQFYTNAIRTAFQKGSPAAIPFIRRALDLDPNFAVAHLVLGLTYGNMGEASLAAESIGKAYDLRDRVSEPEKYWITVHYFNVTGQMEKIPPVCQVWSQNYPRNWQPHNLMALAYIQLGQYAPALSEAQLAGRLSEGPLAAFGLARINLLLDRLAEAKTVIHEALAHNPDQLRFHQGEYILSFFERDVNGMQDQLAWAMHRPGAESLLFSMQSDTEAYFGRIDKARELSELAIESARQNEFVERAALLRANEAAREAAFGNAEVARKMARVAVGLAPGRDVRVLAALALARGGDVAQARKWADQLNDEFRLSTLIQSYWLPAIRAEIELRGDGPKRAIELLRATAPYELAATPESAELAVASFPMTPVYVRAEAFLRAKQGETAAAEFQKILQHRGILGNSPIGALAHLGLARAYALAGDTDNARAKYQDFLTLWKDADPDIPILKQARAEHSKIDLKASSGIR